MANKNITKVRLLNVPLEKDYKHTIYFDTKENQTSYFSSRIVRQFENFSYQRKEGFIRIPDRDLNGLTSSFDELLKAGINYVMFQNTAYSNKWFYAFITDIKYIDDGRTDIYFEIDCIQSWLFDFSVKESFVEREHVSDDTIGKHTQPEGLETGEYVSVANTDIEFGETYIVIGSTKFATNKIKGNVYAGSYSGIGYKAFRLANYESVNACIEELDGYGSGDAIQTIFLCPYIVIKGLIQNDNTISGSLQATSEPFMITKNHEILGNYSPKNRKLFTYPFNYLLVSNNNGGSAIYNYEHFEHTPLTEEDNVNVCDFKLYGAISPGCSIKLVPENYKGVISNVEESINAGKFPICNWSNDAFTNWMTQNAVNVPVSILSSGAQIVGGLALMGTGAGALAGASAIASGGLGVASSIGQVYQQSLVPPQTQGNINCGDVITAMGKNKFTFYQMTIKGEYALIIDKYFSAYGYKINRFKKPNKCHRSRWWYTKTIDVNIDGAIPQNDLQVIKDCYNNGITFWRNALEIQNYSLDNEIALTDGAITD